MKSQSKENNQTNDIIVPEGTKIVFKEEFKGTKAEWIRKILDWTLMTAFIGLVIYAIIDGQFLRKETIEVCYNMTGVLK